MKRLKIAFVASEAHPFVKTGGLADVAYSLPKSLAEAGHEVVLFLPRYYKVDRVRFECVPVGGPLGVPLGCTEKWCGVLMSRAIPGVRTIFIEHDSYFGRDGLYDDGYSAFSDNAERFTFFNRAVLQACMALGFDPDIIHCNDWQTALIPIYIKTLYRFSRFFKKTKSVMTIHNIGYQGVFDKNEIHWSQLGWESYNEDCLKFYDMINFMKGGILWSDAITTVSEKYAVEIQTPEFGYDLSGILLKRKKQLFGITNGVDYGCWDPATDEMIPVKYSSSKMHGKVLCKEYLQFEFGLKVNPDIPLMATVSRLTHQKGIDVLVQSLSDLALRTDFQFVILGTGDQHLIDAFNVLKGSYPDRIGVYWGYSNPLAHKIEAAADIYLMPSRYEPCGLNQMYSLHYGTIPVVRATGGLDDTVVQWNGESKTGTGFKFTDIDRDALSHSVLDALNLYADRPDWEIIRKNAMKFRLPWETAVAEYEKVYSSIISAIPC